MTIMSEIKDQGACKRSALTVSDRAGIMKDMRNSIVSKGVLYSSVARGTNTAESDVDVTMLVHGALDRDTEDNSRSTDCKEPKRYIAIQKHL